jgi:hypothetical protein
MDRVAQFWVVEAVDGGGRRRWWQQGLRMRPDWSDKLTPACLYLTEKGAAKLANGEGSEWFYVGEGWAVRVVKLSLVEEA